MRRVFLRLMLALALVAGQTGVLAHALSHLGAPAGAGAERREGPAAPPGAHCDLCAACAAADTVAGPPAPAGCPRAEVAHATPPSGAPVRAPAPEPPPFSSRAPPRPS